MAVEIRPRLIVKPETFFQLQTFLLACVYETNPRVRCILPSVTFRLLSIPSCVC